MFYARDKIKALAVNGQRFAVVSAGDHPMR
jgi:hypothetical protein